MLFQLAKIYNRVTKRGEEEREFEIRMRIFNGERGFC